MKKRYPFLFAMLVCFIGVKSQNPPPSYTFPSPDLNPTSTTGPQNKRATTDILMNTHTNNNVTTVFSFNPTTTAGLLNLNLSSYPSYVNNNYVNMNPTVYNSSFIKT